MVVHGDGLRTREATVPGKLVLLLRRCDLADHRLGACFCCKQRSGDLHAVVMSNGEDLTRRLADLLRDPRETLDVELKEWLDIAADAEHKATLAKALIALANHGGGYVVFGFAETDDGVVPAEPRPPNLATYTPDAVNSIVRRFAEPPFHCDVQLVTSPETGFDHPVVSVPGGHQVPIRSRRSGPEERIIQADRYYIRRPGPCSEAPQGGQEWDALIRRCIGNAREDLVDRFRVIMAGGAAVEVPETDLDRASRWFDSSVERWWEMAETLPADHGARMQNGHYAVGYQEVGDFDPPRGPELLEALRQGCVRHTGWPPFWVPTREGIAPYMYEGNVECWLGRDGEDRDAAQSDYWRASPEAQLFLLRGYQEDASQNPAVEPGTIFDLTLPTWRMGEILLHAASMARQFGAERARVVFIAEWTGLAGRRLAAFVNPNRLLEENYVARQDTYHASLEVQADQIEDTLPELVDRIVRPLYELFDFFTPPPTLVAEELARMRSHRF